MFNDELEEMIDADQMRTETISEEELYLQRRDNILSDIMGSMRKKNKFQGHRSHAVGFSPKTFADKSIAQRQINDIVKTFTDLGYVVTVTDIPAEGVELENLDKQIKISWSK